MDADRWKSIKNAFAEIVEAESPQRERSLAALEPGLRGEVEKLLSAHLRATDFIREPILLQRGAVENGSSDDDLIGQRIDGYLILEKIGSGGMGAVYLAERDDSDFVQKAALKLIKRGMDTSAVLKRFLMERQILASLEHPNIARLLDGGATESGVPYFLMEYVRGDEIRKYCRHHGLDTRARLEIFQKVCSAVAYAHQKLVVHRDIKPSNIIVTADGEPKLLDFGIGKFLTPDWNADTAEATATNMRALTPEYASPEQIRGEPTSTSTDVYSLGVVLYELLTGARPYKFDSQSPIEMANKVLTKEPVRPSAVVLSPPSGSRANAPADPTAAIDIKRTGDASTEPQPAPVTNARSLKGDLDNIILKAIRREPERRYQSVPEFIEDINRYLNGLPVKATADTRLYRVRKFVSRHRLAVSAAAVVAVVLAAATAITAWQYTIARRERALADERFGQVRKLANTVLFDYYDKIRNLPGTIELRQKIVNDALAYLDSLRQNSDNDPSLERDLIKAYQKVGEVQFGLDNGNLGDSTGAKSSFQKAVSVAEVLAASPDATDDDRLLLADTYSNLAGITGETGDIQGDIALKQKAIAIYSSVAARNPDRPELQTNLARSKVFLATPLAITGDDEGCIRSLREAADIYSGLVAKSPDDRKQKRNLAVTYNYLSRNLTRTGSHDEGIELGRRAVEISTELAAADPDNSNAAFDLTAGLYSLGLALNEAGRSAEARNAFAECLKGRAKLNAADPKNAFYRDNTADAHFQLGVSQARMGNASEAIASFRAAMALMEQSIAADAADVFNQIRYAQYRSELGYTLMLSAAGKKDVLNAALAELRGSKETWAGVQAKNAVPKFNEIEILRNESRIAECEKLFAG